MVFIPITPITPYIQNEERDSNILLSCPTKKVVVKGMDFVIRNGYIKSISDLEDKIKQLANGRVIIDYQVIPYKASDYGMYIDEYSVIVTCKKGRFD